MRTCCGMVLATTVLAGCAPVPGAGTDVQPVLIDDGDLYNRLMHFAERLAEEGKVTPIAELRTQLGRSACTMALSPAPTGGMTPDRIYATYRPSVLGNY